MCPLNLLLPVDVCQRRTDTREPNTDPKKLRRDAEADSDPNLVLRERRARREREREEVRGNGVAWSRREHEDGRETCPSRKETPEHSRDPKGARRDRREKILIWTLLIPWLTTYIAMPEWIIRMIS